jgi:hypothetical protein
VHQLLDRRDSLFDSNHIDDWQRLLYRADQQDPLVVVFSGGALVTDRVAVDTAVDAHFAQVLAVQPDLSCFQTPITSTPLHNAAGHLSAIDDAEVFRDVTDTEVTTALSRMCAHSSSAGTCGLSPQHLRAAMPVVGARVCSLFTSILRLQHWPVSWKEAHVVPIPKGGNDTDCRNLSNTRPISTLNTLSRVLSSVIVSTCSVLCGDIADYDVAGNSRQHSAQEGTDAALESGRTTCNSIVWWCGRSRLTCRDGCCSHVHDDVVLESTQFADWETIAVLFDAVASETRSFLATVLSVLYHPRMHRL